MSSGPESPSLATRLALLSSEKFPTDLDRNPSGDQPYETGATQPSNAVSWSGIQDSQRDATLVTLFGILVKRYVREPEIEVGFTIDGNRSLGLPLHGVVSQEWTIHEAVDQVASLMNRAKDIRTLGSNVDLLAQPFYYTDSLPREWVHVSFVNLDARQLDLYLKVHKDEKEEGTYTFSIRYNKKLFVKATMDAMLRCWETLVMNAKTDPQLNINVVPVVSDYDANTLIRSWNDTDKVFEPKLGIHQLFEASVDAFPNQLAIIGPSHDKTDPKDYELTYQDVESRANQLCHHLISNGVVPGSIVGILLERSTTFYIAMLATLKAGAAYVSIDPEYPDDRIEYMLQDSAAKALITTHVLGKRIPSLPGLAFLRVDDQNDMAAVGQHPTTRPQVELNPELLCYVIYTSGSTGKPKGVQLSHANVLNLIRAEEVIYGVKPEDRVLQGFSTSFDASVEEIWMAFHNRATLIVGTKGIMRSGPDFPKYMAEYGVTCLSTVPTLLSTLEEDFPGVRLIITGGEACSKELVHRWATPSRRFFNTYGPTEATVIATYKECTPGTERMSIGVPLPNYQCYILDENMNLLPPGAIGELVLGGVSVSRRGYLNIPEKTRSVFKPDTLTQGPYPLYKSGDLARFSSVGNIEYLGRADSQVKIRGYRVELSEIESVICEYPGVKSAVADVQTLNGVKYLVAFIIPQSNNLNTTELIAVMKGKLPAFMMPSVIEKIDNFPTLPSGKVERRRLPRVMERIAAEQALKKRQGSNRALIAKMGFFEQEVARAWDEVFGAGTVTTNQDDFFELGGHSFLVSKLVTLLRQKYPGVAATDVYGNPVLANLAKVIEQLAPVENKPRPLYTPSRCQTLFADIMQTLLMYVLSIVVGLNSMAVLILFFTFRNWPIQHLIPFLAAVSLVIIAASLALNVAVKWLLLGRLKEGDYPLWGWFHIRFWFVQALDDLMRAYYTWLFSGTPLLNCYHWLMGTKVGKDVFIGGAVEGYDLITLGDGCTLNTDSCVSAITIEDNMLKLRRVILGKGVTVGVRAYIQGDVRVGDFAKVDAMASVASGTVVGDAEKWAGSPATKHSMLTAPASNIQGVGCLVGFFQLLWIVFWQCMTWVYLIPFVYLVRKVHVFNLFNLIDGQVPTIKTFGDFTLTFMALHIGMAFIGTVEVALLKRVMLLGMEDTKVYPLNSLYYFRRWAVDSMVNSCGSFTKMLRGTIYLPLWFKVMGAKVGRHAEVSAYINCNTEKMALGDHVFIADDVVLGMPHVEEGIVTHEKVRVGNKAFVGNGSTVRTGTRIQDQMLVAVLSLAPKFGDAGVTYMGNPPIKINKREGDTHAAENAKSTYEPPLHMLIARYVVEFLGFLLLQLALALPFAGCYMGIELSYVYLHDGLYAVVLPLFVMGQALFSCLIVIVLKWIIIGRFQPGSYPLYGTYVWRTELVERLEENVAQANAFPLISGTVWLQLFYQAMGMKMGKRCFLDHPCICEPDLITAGDYLNVERSGTLQAHLFQDRVRTTGHIQIGNGCSVGSSTVVLIGATLGDGVAIGSLSMVPRSEAVPPNTKWLGLPAKPLVEPHAPMPTIKVKGEDDGEAVSTKDGARKKEPHPPAHVKRQISFHVVVNRTKGEEAGEGKWEERPIGVASA